MKPATLSMDSVNNPEYFIARSMLPVIMIRGGYEYLVYDGQ